MDKKDKELLDALTQCIGVTKTDKPYQAAIEPDIDPGIAVSDLVQFLVALQTLDFVCKRIKSEKDYLASLLTESQEYNENFWSWKFFFTRYIFNMRKYLDEHSRKNKVWEREMRRTESNLNSLDPAYQDAVRAVRSIWDRMVKEYDLHGCLVSWAEAVTFGRD